MRKIIVGVVAVAIWVMAVAKYMEYRSAEQQRPAARKPDPPPPPPAFGPGREQYKTFFKERHPLSTKSEIVRRIPTPPATRPAEPPPAPDATPEDYDISKEIFLAYVPPNYDASVPHGIIYYMGYKNSDSMPSLWKQTLNESHTIFIAPISSIQPGWQRAAIALDAIQGLKAQFKIDERRIYLFGYPQAPGLLGFQMGIGFPDIFSGFVHIDRLIHYRPVQVPTRGTYPARVARSPAPLLAAAKTRPHAFVMKKESYFPPGQPDYMPLFENAYRVEGFTQLLFIRLTDDEDLHYHNFKGPWLSQTLAFLDAANKEPAAKNEN